MYNKNSHKVNVPWSFISPYMSQSEVYKMIELERANKAVSEWLKEVNKLNNKE